MTISRRKFAILSAFSLSALASGKYLLNEEVKKHSPSLKNINLSKSKFIFLAYPKNSQLSISDSRMDGMIKVVDSSFAQKDWSPIGNTHSIIERPEDKDTILLIPKGTGNLKEFNLSTSTIVNNITPMKDHVFWGHGGFMNDTFCVSERALGKYSDGSISIRNKQDLSIIHSFDSRGYAHECKQDIQQDLIIAAGPVISTELALKNHFSTVRWFDPVDGKLRGQSPCTDLDTNMTHFAQSKNGMLIVAGIYKFSLSKGSGFVYFGKNGETLQRGKAPKNIENQMIGQTLGIAADFEQNIAAVTHPNANIISFWDIDNKSLIEVQKYSKPLGAVLSYDKKHFVFTTPSDILFMNVKTLKVENSIHHGGEYVNSHLLVMNS